ncbi:MAG: ankyrin repeat domain-containing protein [Fibrobacter sp.]|nr:ankyrin repeat domain-containing protein [Fibrobacter sp.]
MSLNRACSKGDLASVKKIVNDGADINAIDSRGRTALFEAAWGGYNDIVKFLLDNGANANLADSTGYTPVMRAAEEGHDSVVATLVQKGADVNVHGKVRGTTALMLAAEHGHCKTIEKLIDAGAKVNAIDHYEETALARAYRTNQTKAAELIESKGGRGKPERNTFQYADKEPPRPLAKAAAPQWTAAPGDGVFDDDDVAGAGIPDEGFDEEE